MAVAHRMTRWFSRLSGNAQGACWMMISIAGFTVMTSLIKFLGADYSASQQTVFRAAVQLVLLSPLIIRTPQLALTTTRLPLVLLRGGLNAGAMALTMYSYQHLPMAQANALSFTRPFWLVPLAAFVLKEKVGAPRLIALGIGFAGTLVMLQPWSDQGRLSLAHAAALLAALAFALTIISSKSLSSAHTTLSLTTWATILMLLLCLPTAVLTWRWPTPTDVLLLTCMSVGGLINQAAFIKGLTVGDAAAMAPLDYSRLVLAVAAGFVFFGEVPDLMTLAGAAIIVASTLWITLRREVAS